MNFLIKLFPEMTIKSKPVRKQQTRQLRQNIRRILVRLDERIAVTGRWDKLEVAVPDDVADLGAKVADELQRIPGIANILEVRDYPLTDFDDVLEKTLQSYREQVAGKRFEVRVKRAGKHEFSSQQLERYLGGGLRDHCDGAVVDLSNPDVTVQLEVRDNRYYIIERRYEGLGGFPIGSLDTVISLVSGGFDSVVATYLAMRRGLRSHFLFFNLGGMAHEAGVKQVALYLWERYGSSHNVRFISVPFEDVIGEMMRSVHHSQRGVILKRLMLRAAERIAAEMHVPALVTGESVAQVSSQTLTNLSVIDQASKMMVLRPLIMMDKQDIIRIARDIGTEEFAKNMPEYCGVISDRPTTRARDYRIEYNESLFDDAVLEAAIENRTVMNVAEVLDSQATALGDVDVVTTPAVEDVVVDIRHPGEEEKDPLHLTNNDVLRIPFYELNQRFAELSPDRRYLLYCDKGTMSQMHASHLKASGHENVLVYKP
ncbi:tRNA uracil 4-sulfurtransferase ThiI [Marinobacteraceae bacterium S3BR75-40.1]